MVSSVTEEQGSHKTDLAHEEFDHEDADPDASRLIKWKARGQPPAQALAQVILSNLKQLMPSITMPHRSTFPFGFANNKGAFTAQNTLYPTTVTGLQSFFTIYHSLKCVKKRDRWFKTFTGKQGDLASALRCVLQVRHSTVHRDSKRVCALCVKAKRLRFSLARDIASFDEVDFWVEE